MITPSLSPSTISVAQGKRSAPYAGPERRVADRRSGNDASSRAGGYSELGPYLHERTARSKQRTPPVASRAIARAAAAESTVSDVVSFEVLDEEFIMAEAILAEPAISLPRAGVELPWITAFLDDVPDAVVHANERDSAAVHVAEADATADADVDAPVITAAREVVTSSAESAAIEAELWPLDDAGSRMRELADALESHTGSDDANSAYRVDAHAHDAASVTPLAMWSDDDFVDVMPVHATSLPSHVATPHITHVKDNSGAQESAALALEALARRVRRGEVDFPAFDAELGDAAALATALVVLLGPRA